MVQVPAVELKQVSFSRKGKIILNNVSVSVMEGEFVAILGSNGAGKSTFLQLILGLEKPDHGIVTVAGKRVRKGNNMIGYTPQTINFDPEVPLTGWEYISMGMTGIKWVSGFHMNKVNRRITEVVEQLDAMDIVKKKLGKMSGGEQQKILLAQSLVHEPAILLLDEPLANLDLSKQHELLKRIIAYHKIHNRTVCLVTHDIAPLIGYIDKVIYIANTKLKMGRPDDVIRDEVLSELYGTPVKVIIIDGRYFIATVSSKLHETITW